MAESREKSDGLSEHFLTVDYVEGNWEVFVKSESAVPKVRLWWSHSELAAKVVRDSLELHFAHHEKQVREAGRRDALEEQWISVEEKLPKCEGYYLVVHVRRGIDMLWSNPASPSDLWYWKSEVTHWRELPEPPKVAIRALEEKPQ